MKKGHYFAKFAKSFKKGYKSSEKRTEKLFANDLFAKNLAVFTFAFLAGIAAGKSFNVVNHSFAEGISETTPKIEQSILVEKPVIEKVSNKTISSSNASAKNYTTYASYPTSKSTAIAQNDLYIPKIGLNEPVLAAPDAKTPDYNVGQYGRLLIGHRAGVFAGLPALTAGDKISLHSKNYTVYSTGSYAVTDNNTRVNGESTISLGYNSKFGNDIILMTCDGTGNSHRILVFARPD